MLKRKRSPIAEHEARGHTARIYHEICQTLRVSGVNLNFRRWATFPEFFPVMWAGMQPLAASDAFESAADGLRARAVDLAFTLPPLQVRAALGERSAGLNAAAVIALSISLLRYPPVR